MTFRLANRIVRLPEQFFSGLTRRVAAFQQAGHDVINLGQGNPDLPTPSHIVEALREAVLDPVTHRYPPFRGLPELKEAAADFYRRTYGVRLDPEREIAILVGGKTGLVEIAELYLEPGDVALVPDPGYPDYLSGIALAGAEPHALPITSSNGYIPNLEAVPQAVWERAKVWYLNYPNNPTGAGTTARFFEQAIQKARQHGVLIVHDFAYGAIGYDDHRPPSFLQIEGAKEVGIEIYTLSKTFNMAGWRVAFAAGHEEVIEHINRIQDHYYVSIFAAVQRASVAALRGPADEIEALRQTYQRRRDAFLGALRSAGIEAPSPQGSFFCWIPLPSGVSSVAFANALLEEAHVAVAPGRGFGEHGEGHVRVGLLAPEDRLVEAAERMARFWARQF